MNALPSSTTYVKSVNGQTGDVDVMPTTINNAQIDEICGETISNISFVKTEMDTVAVAGTMYILGEVSTLDIVLPDDADIGKEIEVIWYNGTTPVTLSISGTILDFDYVPNANTRSEINALWDGSYWAIVSNEMEVPI